MSAATLVGETAFGDRYDITALPSVRFTDGTRRAVVSVSVAEKGGPAAASLLTLTPDEARALAADLTRWAGHAETEGRKP